ncbi:hypothetical protein E8E13_000909 [Curvularia kusanoi]|uniref:Uncharacterized protein n=1 Tax=Curvularia kusanoi TaxID=90978 RepID=A0A9P4T328_CURKU|nr:hypothetical protein E8E13_000909 [Curvularia kusanoi]
MPDPVQELQRSPREAKKHFLAYLKDEVFTLNFYRAHMLYFIVVIAVSSVIVYGEGVKNGPKEFRDSHLSYMDALFLTCSAMTTTGLNSVDLGDLSGFQQAVLCILLMIGNIPFVSMVVVLIRLSLFRKRMSEVVKHSRTMQRLVQDIEDNRRIDEGSSGSNNSLRQREIAARNVGGTNKQQTKPVKPRPLNRRRTFHHQTGFGFVPTPWETKMARNFFRRIFDSMTSELQPEKHDYVSFKPHLDSRGRFLELSEHDRLELGGVEYRALQALLFILIGYQLFWYLFGIVFLMPYAYRTRTKDILREAQPGGLNPGWWAFFSTVTEFSNGGLNVLNANFIPFSGMPYILIVADIEALPTGTRILDGLFQATGLRTSGAYIIAFSSLAPACLVVYLVIMYISSYPLVMTLRKTNTYEERSIGLNEGDDTAAGIATHLQKQLAYDIWFQFLAFFLVSIIERGHILKGDPGFDSFSVLFEVTSAYGTVGLSTGVPGEDYSLSGSFASLSKVVMLFVMVRGREELMQRLDLEYGGREDAPMEDLQELVTRIEESGTETEGNKSAATQRSPEHR